MLTALHDKMKSVGSKRRRKIEARATELVAEEMALCELRKAHHHTQASVARQLGISQDGVSRLEKRSDVLLSHRRRARGNSTRMRQGGHATVMSAAPRGSPRKHRVGTGTPKA